MTLVNFILRKRHEFSRIDKRMMTNDRGTGSREKNDNRNSRKTSVYDTKRDYFPSRTCALSRMTSYSMKRSNVRMDVLLATSR